MKERRKHKRLPMMRDLAQPIELAIVDGNGATVTLPGVLTSLSAGGMNLVLMGVLKGHPDIRLNMHLPGFDHFEVEGKLIWTRAKESTSIVGIEFSKIDPDHANQISHMAEAYWECEDRIKKKAPIVCFHGCVYWDLCDKPAKLRDPNPRRSHKVAS